jgi:hypothetical protein
VGSKRRFVKVNKKKVYPRVQSSASAMLLRASAAGRPSVNSLTAALAARATKEAALLSEVPTTGILIGTTLTTSDMGMPLNRSLARILSSVVTVVTLWIRLIVARKACPRL